MSKTAQVASGSPNTKHRPKIAGLFRVVIGRFREAPARATIDVLVRWVEDFYREDLAKRPSKHVYIRLLPENVIAQIDSLRDSRVISEAILRRFDAGSVITPMKHTDELYISHYNKDFGGDQGLYGKHYDGNLRFLKFGTVVRALIYLQSDATYTVVFADSLVEKAFATYDFGIIDFHRELHWVEGDYNPADKQRILLKCNYLVAPRNGGVLARMVLSINTAVFYVVKAAMEYSKSPRTPAQRVVGFFCNAFRVMNNVHPFVPIGFILGVAGAIGWAGYRLVA